METGAGDIQSIGTHGNLRNRKIAIRKQAYIQMNMKI